MISSLSKWPVCLALSFLAASQTMAQTTNTVTANTAAGSLTVDTTLYSPYPAQMESIKASWSSDGTGQFGGFASYFPHASEAGGGLLLTFSGSDPAFPMDFGPTFKYVSYYGAHSYASYRAQTSHADAGIPILTNLNQPSETGFNVTISGLLNESFGSTETPFPLTWDLSLKATDANENVITVLSNTQTLTGALQNQPFSLTAQIPVGFSLSRLNLSSSLRIDTSVAAELVNVAKPGFSASANISAVQITPFVTSVPENQTAALMGLGLCGLGLLRRLSKQAT